MNRDIQFMIHPAIGVGRVGNSEEYYFCPETPGAVPECDGFKDSQGATLRQGVRFRVFRYEDGTPVEEIACDRNPGIEWRVHVANRKAAWYKFEAAMDLPSPISKRARRRNPELKGVGRRSSLVIDSRSQSIGGVNAGPVSLRGTFVGEPVDLGELYTDAQGRLVFLGGSGKCGSFDGRVPSDDDNDGFFDDVCDGPVRARVTWNGKQYEAIPAVVVVGPPNFCQGISPVVSMYDIACDLFDPVPPYVEFWKDIYPILERLVRCQWSNEGIFQLMGFNAPADFTNDRWREVLSDPNVGSGERYAVFRLFRNPSNAEADAPALPPFYGDGFDKPNSALYYLSITRRQYACLHLWAEGKFIPGCPPKTAMKLDVVPTADRPAALDRAAFEDLLGGSFHPGIELPWIMRIPSMWERPFRLKVLPENRPVRDDYGEYLEPEVCMAPDGPASGAGPGTLTRWMGAPWQTDAVSCHAGYDKEVSAYLPVPSFWAARVPNHVLSRAAYDRIMDPAVPYPQKVKSFSRRQSWFRDIAGSSYEERLMNSVKYWDQLGILTVLQGPTDGSAPTSIWVETGRGKESAPDPYLELLNRLDRL